MSISTDIRQPHMQLPHFRVVGVRVNLTELSADDLRRELVALATFRCELDRGQPVFARAAFRESCPSAQLFVDGEASDARR